MALPNTKSLIFCLVILTVSTLVLHVHGVPKKNPDDKPIGVKKDRDVKPLGVKKDRDVDQCRLPNGALKPGCNSNHDDKLDKPQAVPGQTSSYKRVKKDRDVKPLGIKKDRDVDQCRLPNGALKPGCNSNHDDKLDKTQAVPGQTSPYKRGCSLIHRCHGHEPKQPRHRSRS